MAEIVDFGLQQHKIKMDSRYFENVLSVVAGDTGRRIEVQLLDTNGMVQDTTGLSLRLNAEIAGKSTYTDATLVDATTGKYQLDLSNGMFLAPGNWQFQWLIIDSVGKKLHSFAFTGNIGKNISEGGSQATNFYLNLEDLKAMQEDLVNGTIESSILETTITEKLTDLETQYAPKLTEVTSQLAQKADANEVRKRNVPIGLNDAAPDLLQAVSDSPGTPFNLLSIPRPYSVTHEKTTFAEKVVISDNLIDLTEITEGYTLNTNTGELLVNALYNISGFTEVETGSIYFLPYTTNIYKFDIDQKYIGYETGVSFTPTTGVSFVRSRIAVESTVPFRMNKDSLKTWDEYRDVTKIKNLSLDEEKIKDFVFPGNELPSNIDIPQDRFNFIYRNSPNLFNKDTVTLDKRLSSGNTTVDDINNTISDYIEVFPETTYSVTEGSYTHFLGENDVFISGHGVGIKTFTTPPGTKRIKTTVRKSKLNVFMLVLGDVVPTEADYVPYDKYAFTDNIEVARETKPFEGQSLAFNGDSIVQNGGYMLSQIKNALGFATVTNYGIGGTAYTPRLAPWDTNAISLRYTEMSNDHDVIAFLAGTNDFKSPEITLDSFRQAVRLTFEGLVSKYPTKKLVVFTMPPRYDKSANGETVFQYADVLLEEAGNQSIPCFDLLRFSQLRPWNEENKAAFIPDGLHPSTPDGYDKMLPKMIEAFKTV